MTSHDFMAGTYGTYILTGTNALTGQFAGFKAIGDTVVAAISVNGVSQTVATYLGSATVADGVTFTVPGYTNGILITSITLTSGSLLMIKGG